MLAFAVAVVAVAGMPRGAEADPAIDGEEQAFLGLINNYRAQNGLGTLSFNTELNNAGDWMSNDMGVNDYFSH
ncbi:MAG: CAP domain-containing protein, partial [Dehalococcoidia bacterium]